MNLFYVPADSGRSASFALALIDAISCAKGKTSGVRLAVNAKKNIPNFLDEIVKGNARREITNKGETQINGIRFSLQTERTLNAREPVILAAYVTSEFLEELIANAEVTDIFYVPHILEELDNFLIAHPNAKCLVPPATGDTDDADDQKET